MCFKVVGFTKCFLDSLIFLNSFLCNFLWVFVFPGRRPSVWPPALAPNLHLPALVPNLCLPALAPDLYLPALAPNMYLMALAPNLYLPTLAPNLYLLVLPQIFICRLRSVRSLSLHMPTLSPQFVFTGSGLRFLLPCSELAVAVPILVCQF